MTDMEQVEMIGKLINWWADKDKPKPPREPSPGPEPGPEYQCGNCGYISDKPGRCPRCGETI